MILRVINIFLFLVPLLAFAKGYEPFLSFSASKTALNSIYANHKVLPVSGCRYSFEEQTCSMLGHVDFESCGFRPHDDEILAQTVQFMHVVSSYEFGHTLPCMNEKICKSTQSEKMIKGVACCKRHDPLFRKMYSDMHNIIPVISEIKHDRGEFGFDEVTHKEHWYAKVPVYISKHQNNIEPIDASKGMIARAYLYMIQTYDLHLPLSQVTTLKRWHQSYPVSTWEKELNLAIYRSQGTYNPFVEDLSYNITFKKE